MAEESRDRLFPASDLHEFTMNVLVALSIPEGDAKIAADSLIDANLRGVDTHGITRLLGIYVKRIRAGIVNKDGQIEIESESPSTIHVNGRNCLGSVVAHKAMQRCLQKAELAGSCWAGIRNTNHAGAMAYWAMEAVERDMVGIAWTNGPASMAPWGGAQAYLSTNPMAFAIPAGQEPPIVLDMATSAVSRGRIILAASRGERIPLGWALDPQGRPTEDAAEGVKGFVMPMSTYKGYGLSLLVDLLCGTMTGAAFGPRVGSLYEEMSKGQDVGTLLGAIQVSRFLPIDVFKARVDQEIREIKACRLAEGCERILVPGELEHEKKSQRLVDGIPLDDIRIKEFTAIGDELGVPFPA